MIGSFRRRVVAGAVIVTGLALAPAAAAAPAPGLVVVPVANGLGTVTAFASAPDGRVFVATKAGAIRVLRDGALVADPVLVLAPGTQGERGLIGLAVPPDFTAEPRLVVHYTATTPNVHNRVAVVALEGDRAVGVEAPVLDLPPLGPTNHNGGGIGFGADGALYVAVGDNDIAANAPDLTTPLGKVLRVGLDGSPAPGNPYLGQAGVDERIWASGLRNPYSLAIAGADVVLFDVGEDTWEEVNQGVAGADYGWPATEGPTTAPGVTAPIYAYSSTGGACSVIGGAITSATGPLPAPYRDRVVFADFCAGWVQGLDRATGSVVDLATDLGSITALALDRDGTVLVGTASGAVVRIASAGPEPVIPEVPVAPLLGGAAALVLGITAWSRSGRGRGEPAPA